MKTSGASKPIEGFPQLSLEEILKKATKKLGLCVDDKHSFGKCDCKDIKSFISKAFSEGRKSGDSHLQEVLEQVVEEIEESAYDLSGHRVIRESTAISIIRKKGLSK